LLAQLELAVLPVREPLVVVVISTLSGLYLLKVAVLVAPLVAGLAQTLPALTWVREIMVVVRLMAIAQERVGVAAQADTPVLVAMAQTLIAPPAVLALVAAVVAAQETDRPLAFQSPLAQAVVVALEF
jgi:hypothetical protein